jgi:hypothetical protein
MSASRCMQTHGTWPTEHGRLGPEDDPAQGLLYCPMNVKVDFGLFVSVMALNTLNNSNPLMLTLTVIGR